MSNKKQFSISKELLERLFFIDLEQGSIQWREPKQGRQLNKEAGSINNCGYRVIRIDGTQYVAHHLIWLYATGKYPIKDLDHIDRNRSNNKISNLREVTRQEQNFNTTVKQGKSLPIGVTFRSERKKPYHAHIRISNKLIYLGCYKTIKEAHNTYLKAKEQYHKIVA